LWPYIKCIEKLNVMPKITLFDELIERLGVARPTVINLHMPKCLRGIVESYTPDLLCIDEKGNQCWVNSDALCVGNTFCKIIVVKTLIITSRTKFHKGLVSITGPGAVKCIGDMSRMFYNCSSFNSKLAWDTSLVTNMSYMFCMCTAFNQPLDWDTSQVTNMYAMFEGCKVFNQLLKWDTSQVNDMRSMFWGCTAFNQPLDWNTSQVTNMRWMFYVCIAFNQQLDWDTSQVTNMEFMFYGCIAFNQQLDWDTSQVTDMRKMF
jgi:surface protein